MSTQNGQKQCPHCKAVIAPRNAQAVPKIPKLLTSAQLQLLEFTDQCNAPDLVNALQLLHDMALYQSDHVIDEDEKNALFSAKQLWEHIAALLEVRS
ncbi:hypothetical protein LV716_16120 [Flagellimonas sp. HMM57]|uniref:hypothetical protein n=1 Tax=unclassified Flagellimonas TaxID=2644544 RepID=UPI0013D08C13|nr:MULTISPECIES: hypothetical protein [unclassified Flagellimonas]UII75768.1 hypothetical protein LV716_16120 [Flagellimonas sp. HMM57]